MLVDWNKPLMLELGEEVYYVGPDPEDKQKVVLMMKNRLSFVIADKLTGKLFYSRGYVVNKLEPWLQAFELWKGQPAEQDYSVEQTFKEAFELGRSWK